MDFEQVLKEVVWRLVTEGSVSYRRIKRSFGLDDDALEDVRRVLISGLHIATDLDGEFLVLAADGRAARPEPMALPQRFPALRHAEKPTALAAERDLPATAPVSAVIAAPSDAERRQLTVMFCDLVGSTALSTAMDPEDLRDVIASYQTRCSAAIRRYDGFVAKYMGDGILVYFGYPRAHEDEAERSVRAGLDIVDAMAELNAAVPRPPGVELAVRIGIATGPVIVGDQIGEGTASETAVVGETPNLAARLQALALPNQIVVSAATRAMLGDHFDLEDLGGYELKGFAEAVPAWRVLAARDVESRFAATRTGSSAPLVRRQEEMGLLLRAWDGGSRGRGQVVLIQGEAGVGKSRLVEGLREAAGKDHIWVAIRCSPFRTASAFHPIVEHLKRVFGWQPEDMAPQHLAKLEAGLAGFRTLPLSESVRLFADLMSVPAPEDRYPRLAMTAQQQRDATLDAIVAWLIETAERTPALMAWEDLHWADPTTLESLGMLIEQAPTTALLVVATYRPELTPLWPQRSHMTPITLNRLERPEVETMVGHLAGGRSLPGEVVDHIVAKADGVPLYVEELTKAILGSGVLEARADIYVLTGALAQLHIPETLQDSLMARLDRAPQLREVAQLGSVLGREFSYDMISALTGLEEEMLQSGLGQLVVDELLYQRGRPPRSRYLFKHALIQDAAYQSLLKRTRQQYHERAAKLLEDRFPEVASTQPELVAHHYTEASCPAQAIAYWLRAGAAAASKSANIEAIDQFRRGLALVDALSDMRERAERELDLQMALGPALVATKVYGHPDIGRTYARASELCRQLGDHSREFTALRGLYLYHLHLLEMEKAQHFAEEGLRVAERLDDAARLVGAHTTLGGVLYFQGKLDPALAQFRRGFELFDPNMQFPDWPGSHPSVQCQFFPALISWMLGYPDRSLDELQAALGSAETLGHPVTLAQTLCNAALVYILRHEPSAAADYAGRALRICEEQRIAHFHAFAFCENGWALSATGEKEKGAVQIAQGVDGFGLGAGQHMLLALQADAQLAIGKPEAALASVAAGLKAVEKAGGAPLEAELYRLRGEALLAGAGTVSEAETAMQQAIDVARRQNAKSWELRGAMSLARLRRQQDRRQEAVALLAPILGWFTEGFDTADLQAARTLLDEIASSLRSSQ
ncbi:MAG TPA: adenylate/guanylate cyclase domain-containing protein [Stellaceae bacterium]|nr:adenylate/guanylate cyclase domain-containing protein [Stellaceae bacterium]